MILPSSESLFVTIQPAREAELRNIWSKSKNSQLGNFNLNLFQLLNCTVWNKFSVNGFLIDRYNWYALKSTTVSVKILRPFTPNVIIERTSASDRENVSSADISLTMQITLGTFTSIDPLLLALTYLRFSKVDSKKIQKSCQFLLLSVARLTRSSVAQCVRNSWTTPNDCENVFTHNILVRD